MSRSVSFVDRLELEFPGNHFCHALTLGDVDGDGLNEFIIGNVEGTLAIFKGNGTKMPWRKCKGLGTITCAGTGDVFNTGKIQLVCINANGMCYIFSVYQSSSPIKGISRKSSDTTLQPIHIQQLPPNIKVMLIAGIAPDGKEELFVGHTDRVVGVYRWNSELTSLELKYRFTLDGQIGSLSVSMTSNGTPQLLISQAGGTYIPLSYIEIAPDRQNSEDPLTTANKHLSEISSDQGSKQESINISMSVEETRESDVGIATMEEEQQKDNVANGKQKKQKSVITEGETGNDDLRKQFSRQSSSSSSGGIPKHRRSRGSLSQPVTPTSSIVMQNYQLIVCPVVGYVQRGNPTSSTEVVGDLHSRIDLLEGGQRPNIVALCTLDGCIRFMRDEKKIWEHQVDHNLFSIAKLDLTNDGQDEVVVCAWDGTTYILDHSRNVVRYKFEDNVCSFCAGLFGFSSEHNKPCLIYTTFFNKIYVYHNISLSSISPSNLLVTIQKQEKPEHIAKILDNMTDEEKRKLFHQLLYKPQCSDLPSQFENISY